MGLVRFNSGTFALLGMLVHWYVFVVWMVVRWDCPFWTREPLPFWICQGRHNCLLVGGLCVGVVRFDLELIIFGRKSLRQRHVFVVWRVVRWACPF